MQVHDSIISASLIKVKSASRFAKVSALLNHCPMDPIEVTRRHRLAILIREAGSQVALSEKTGKAPAQISQWVRALPDSKTGKPRSMSKEIARELELHCGKPSGWMDQPMLGAEYEDGASGFTSTPINLENNPDYPTIRRVKFKLSAGASGFSVDYRGDMGPPIPFPKAWYERKRLRPDSLFATTVSNGSMEPGLYDGDTVVVNTAQAEPKDGYVFAVNYEGELVIKRLVRDDGQWWLASDNPDKSRYPRKVCHEGVALIGEIVHKQSERI